MGRERATLDNSRSTIVVNCTRCSTNFLIIIGVNCTKLSYLARSLSTASLMLTGLIDLVAIANFKFKFKPRPIH